jgi:predicted Ser/Thr protein kinase
MTEDVPGYRVLEQVGEGGFSVVYLAYQERLDRQVALKVLSLNAIDDSSMRRFQRECKITGRLTGHPNVVTVLDTGTTRSGRPYIAMEYFEHGSLTDRLAREGPLLVADVLRIGVKMAGALAATHETEVLHRDVKPQNILVSRYGEPALADFGIARLVDSFDATHTNAFTPHHAAPEMLEGKPPGVASDLYSLGSTLYQLLAGRPAFKGPQGEGIAQLMLRILGEPPPPIPRDEVPRQVFDVISQAMAKAPEQRFPSAVAFAQRLQRLQGELGLPVTDLAHSGGTSAPRAGAALAGPAAPGAPAVPSGPAGPPNAPAAPPRELWTPAQPGPEAFVALPGPGSATAAPPQAETTAPTAWAQPLAAGSPHATAHAPVHPGSTGPAAWDPPVQPGRIGPDPAGAGPHAPAPPAGASGPKRGLVIAVAVAVTGGLALGVTGIVAFGGSGDGPRPDASTSQSALQSGTGQAPGSPQATNPRTAAPQLTAQQIKAATPRYVRVQPVGTSARLSWTLPASALRLPIIVQRSPAGGTPLTSAGTGAVSTTVGGLRPQARYCFRVGALVAPGNPPTIAWSAARCVRTG